MRPIRGGLFLLVLAAAPTVSHLGPVAHAGEATPQGAAHRYLVTVSGMT
jgi:hypothetical protein